MSKEDFLKVYGMPAVTAVADKLKNGEPLTDIERWFVLSCGLDPDEVAEFYASRR